MVHIINFYSNLLTISKKSHKDIDVYYIGYIVIKKFSDYENNHSVNPLYLIIYSATGYFKEKNRVKTFNSWFDRQIWRSFFWN